MIEKLAHLARLRFSKEELEQLRPELEKITGFMELLNEVDTTGIAPLVNMGAAINQYREDNVQGEMERDKVFSNAPTHENGFFKVPKVIKK